MAKVEIYTKDYCPYCHRAKDLLDSLEVWYTNYDVTNDSEKQAEMIERSEGRKTVPQVFINGKGYGGFDDINALHKEGKLTELLAAA